MAAQTGAELRDAPAFTLPDVFGLRALNRLGPGRLFAVVVLIWLLGQVILVVTVSRPDLLNQTAIGTDSSNYYAAGLRLNDGHPMYRLSPGDRPVPLLPPPHSDAALLSPPILGVVWRPLALLGDASMLLWWLAGIAVLGSIAVWMTLRGSIRRSMVVVLISPGIALAMWSGNVNPFMVALLAGVWAASARGRPGLAGGLLAVAAAFKLTPFFLIWWFVVRRDWVAVRAFVAVGAVLGGISLLGAGLENHIEYIAVVGKTANDGASMLSLSGMLQGLGLPSGIASFSSYAAVLVGATAMWLLRDRPRASFSVGILTVLYSSPVVLLSNLAMLLAATSPFPAQRPKPAEQRTSPWTPGAPAASTVVADPDYRIVASGPLSG